MTRTPFAAALAGAGDVHAGEQPVPVVLWRAPAARPGATVSCGLAARLVATFMRPRSVVLDLTRGRQLAQAVGAHRRRYRRSRSRAGVRAAAFIVAGWPEHRTDAVTLMSGCAGRLADGGCLAVVVTAAALTLNQQLIAAARAVGLRYRQHIVAVADHAGDTAAHSDVLVFSRT